MNCIILLFLLSCCGGWGNGGCCCGRNNNCCPDCRRASNCCGKEPIRPLSDRKQDDCGCEEESHSPHDNDCGCESNERERECCDVSGMVPPPWQEYPSFPRRDNKNEGDCES